MNESIDKDGTLHAPEADWLRVLSVLLQYPDDDLLSRLDEIRSCAEDIGDPEIKSAVMRFIGDLKAHSPVHLRERYTAVFDMNPAATLNLTYHLHGDNEKRAAMLARLQQSYERAGWARISTELPDYLPMMLEFMSICRPAEHGQPVWQCLQGLDALIDRLKIAAPVYADLLQPLARMATTGSPELDANPSTDSLRFF